MYGPIYKKEIDAMCIHKDRKKKNLPQLTLKLISVNKGKRPFPNLVFRKHQYMYTFSPKRRNCMKLIIVKFLYIHYHLRIALSMHMRDRNNISYTISGILVPASGYSFKSSLISLMTSFIDINYKT